MKVTFQINRLTIEGRSRAEGLRIGDALRRQLTDLAGSGVPPTPSTSGRIDAGTLPPGATPEYTGRHLANRIARHLRGPRDA